MVKESDEQRRRGIRGALAKDKRAKAKRRGGGGGSRAKEGERKGRSKAVERARGGEGLRGGEERPNRNSTSSLKAKPHCWLSELHCSPNAEGQFAFCPSVSPSTWPMAQIFSRPYLCGWCLPAASSPFASQFVSPFGGALAQSMNPILHICLPPPSPPIQSHFAVVASSSFDCFLPFPPRYWCRLLVRTN